MAVAPSLFPAPFRVEKRDVSGESRDDHGKWALGGNTYSEMGMADMSGVLGASPLNVNRARVKEAKGHHGLRLLGDVANMGAGFVAGIANPQYHYGDKVQDWKPPWAEPPPRRKFKPKHPTASPTASTPSAPSTTRADHLRPGDIITRDAKDVFRVVISNATKDGVDLTVRDKGGQTRRVRVGNDRSFSVRKAGHDVSHQARDADGRFSGGFESEPAVENMDETRLHQHLTRYHPEVALRVPRRAHHPYPLSYGGLEALTGAPMMVHQPEVLRPDTGEEMEPLHYHPEMHEADHRASASRAVPHEHSEPYHIDDQLKTLIAQHPELVDLATDLQPMGDPVGDAIGEAMETVGVPHMVGNVASQAIEGAVGLVDDPHKYDPELHAIGRFLHRITGSKAAKVIASHLTDPFEHGSDLHTLGRMTSGMSPIERTRVTKFRLITDVPAVT